MGLCISLREGVKEDDIYCEPKSYKFKLLGKLVVQQASTIETNPGQCCLNHKTGEDGRLHTWLVYERGRALADG